MTDSKILKATKILEMVERDSWGVLLTTSEGTIEAQAWSAVSRIVVTPPQRKPAKWTMHQAWDAVIDCIKDGRIRLSGVADHIRAGDIDVTRATSYSQQATQ